MRNGPGTCPADGCDSCYTHVCPFNDVSELYVNTACV